MNNHLLSRSGLTIRRSTLFSLLSFLVLIGLTLAGCSDETTATGTPGGGRGVDPGRNLYWIIPVLVIVAVIVVAILRRRKGGVSDVPPTGNNSGSDPSVPS